MDLKKQLEKEHSKANAQLIARYVGADPDRFDELMQFFFHDKYRISQRAAHAVSHCADVRPHLIEPYIGVIINNLEKNPEVAIRRNSVRLLQSQEIPEVHQGMLVQKCFDYLLSSKETVAVKVFSMTILHNLTKTYPELVPELKIVIKDALRQATPGMVSRGNRILAQLNQ